MANEIYSNLSEDELKTFMSEIDAFEEETEAEFYDTTERQVKQIVANAITMPKVRGAKRKDMDPNVQAEIMRNKRIQNMADKRQRARQIKSEYVMSGNTHLLNEPLEKPVLKIMIANDTQHMFDTAEAIKQKLTRLIEKELKRFIPRAIKVLYNKNKDAVNRNPGFDYISSPYYGSAVIRIEPDIPNVFKNPTELEIIRAKCKSKIFTFDQLVERYYSWTKRRKAREVRLAAKLASTKSLLELIDLGADYYDAYMEAKQQLNNRQNEQ